MCGHFWRAEARLAAPEAVSDAPQNLDIKIKTKSLPWICFRSIAFPTVHD